MGLVLYNIVNKYRANLFAMLLTWRKRWIIMSTKKPVQANYTVELIAHITKEYKDAISLAIANRQPVVEANKAILADLSAKHGKTVASLRAKLASLKIYQSADTTSTSTSVPSKITKEQITQSISKLVGKPLDGLEVAPKQVLLAIAEKLLAQNDKINDLIADLTLDNQA